MIKLKALELKKAIRKKGNENVVDLAEPTLIIDFDSPEFVVESVILVDEELAGRPDLISLVAYGDQNYVDLYLKANGFSNPFAIDVGEKIIIPNREHAKIFYRTPQYFEEDMNDTEKNFLTPERASKQDKERKKKLEELAKKRKAGASEIKPPNQLRQNEEPFSIEDGRVKLGNR